MESTFERKPVLRFANTIFWIGLGSFIGGVTIFLVLSSLEDSRALPDSLFVYNGQRISSGIMYFALWLIGPTALTLIFLHPKCWAKGISFVLFVYVVFMIWVMQPSGQHCCPS
ncbi:MAG: hypothetical protein SFZ03_11870 [Candidatus Melainabacteria bacterium]|nr:hypothetical protein [Candidatus Melainabacteria bacterium]